MPYSIRAQCRVHKHSTLHNVVCHTNWLSELCGCTSNPTSSTAEKIRGQQRLSEDSRDSTGLTPFMAIEEAKYCSSLLSAYITNLRDSSILL